MATAKRIGVLTGGGDAPGLNPAIKGLVYAEDGELIIIDDRHDAFGHARLGGIAE
jgi:6-phosphofructokinase